MPSKPFHGCFGRFAGDASESTNFHSPEWTLVRNKKGKEKKKISKSNFESSNWRRISNQQVNFVVTPKDNKPTYSLQEIKTQERTYQPSPKIHLVKGNGNKKPDSAINRISCKKLDIMIKKMLANENSLAKSGEVIEENITQLRTEIKQSMAVAKAQDALPKLCYNLKWLAVVKLSGMITAK
jgi:hypothetical protein